MIFWHISRLKAVPDPEISILKLFCFIMLQEAALQMWALAYFGQTWFLRNIHPSPVWLCKSQWDVVDGVLGWKDLASDHEDCLVFSGQSLSVVYPTSQSGWVLGTFYCWNICLGSPVSSALTSSGFPQSKEQKGLSPHSLTGIKPGTFYMQNMCSSTKPL